MSCCGDSHNFIIYFFIDLTGLHFIAGFFSCALNGRRELRTLTLTPQVHGCTRTFFFSCLETNAEKIDVEHFSWSPVIPPVIPRYAQACKSCLLSSKKQSADFCDVMLWKSTQFYHLLFIDLTGLQLVFSFALDGSRELRTLTLKPQVHGCRLLFLQVPWRG